MEFIKGISFTSFGDVRGTYCDNDAKDSLSNAKETLGLTHVTLCFLAYQETAQSEYIDYNGPTVPEDKELLEMIAYAQSLDLKVILKPMLDCLDGTWRAHINFFDIDVPCEPKWPVWFKNYGEYIVKYAKLAEESGCEMLVIGTEMVQTERRTSDWIYLINQVRKVYKGLITYNTDKYQESNVNWWKHLDVISASGYYPIDEIETQINRIELFMNDYDMPYFFAECGCPSRTGSKHNPNDWSFKGQYNEEEQNEWHQAFLEATIDREWVNGYTPWSWSHTTTKNSEKDDGYDVYNKLAADTIKGYYSKR